MRRGSRLLALGGLLCLVLMAAGGATAAGALGAVGERLDAFVSSPARNGRAVAISGSTAYLGSPDEMINEANLATHENAGGINTLTTVPSGFGALAFDPSGALWGAKYVEGGGQIYRIDLGANTIEEVFNAYEINPANHQIDGLAIDPRDGALWLRRGGGRRLDHRLPRGSHRRARWLLLQCARRIRSPLRQLRHRRRWRAPLAGGHRWQADRRVRQGGQPHRRELPDRRIQRRGGRTGGAGARPLHLPRQARALDLRLQLRGRAAGRLRTGSEQRPQRLPAGAARLQRRTVAQRGRLRRRRGPGGLLHAPGSK